MENRPKRSIKDLAASGPANGGDTHSRAPTKPTERIIEIPPISRAVLDALNPPKPPPPISIRLEALRAMDDDALMKWLTTESEFPGRALDEGTKMAITMELMRRQAEKPHKPTFTLVIVGTVFTVLAFLYQAAKDLWPPTPAPQAATPALQPSPIDTTHQKPPPAR